MFWQFAAVIILIVAASSYIAVRVRRTWFGAGTGCQGSCSCPAETAKPPNPTDRSIISVDEITSRLRRES